MHKVKNAIILAAGRGSRLKHLTDETPKPLLAPRGITFIEGIIKNLKEKGIHEIIVVTGYKAEKFNFLKDEVILVKNKEWNMGNNITSIKAAIKYVGNSLIINGDIIMKENVFLNEYESSLTYVERNSNIDEWIVKMNGNQVIDFDKNGLGKSGFYQREIIFVTNKLALLIKEEINSFNINEYQEFLMINSSLKNSEKFGIHIIKKDLVFDLDTVDEYKKYINSKIN